GDPVDREGIAVRSGIDRTNDGFPNAVVTLLQLGGRAQVLKVAGVEPDILRLRRQNAQRDAAVGHDLRRNHDGTLRPPSGATAGLSRRRCRRLSQSGRRQDRCRQDHGGDSNRYSSLSHLTTSLLRKLIIEPLTRRSAW